MFLFVVFYASILLFVSFNAECISSTNRWIFKLLRTISTCTTLSRCHLSSRLFFKVQFSSIYFNRMEENNGDVYLTRSTDQSFKTLSSSIEFRKWEWHRGPNHCWCHQIDHYLYLLYFKYRSFWPVTIEIDIDQVLTHQTSVFILRRVTLDISKLPRKKEIETNSTLFEYLPDTFR